MSSTEPVVLVTGATGQQGGAVIRHLPRGVEVRALTRDPKKAQGLERLGVEVIGGDLLDPSSLDAAMRGVTSVFAVTNFWDGMQRGSAPLGADGEVRQGKNLADAAARAKVKHFVFSSVGGAFDYPSEVPHARSKQEIERHIMASELPWTLLRPVFFMDNFNSPFMDFGSNAKEGRVALPLRPTRRLQMVSVEDIGRVAALALSRRDEFLHTAFDVASDALTTAEIADVFTRVTGRRTTSVADSSAIPAITRASPEFGAMWREFDERGTDAFVPGLRSLVPQLERFEGFLRRTGWAG